MAEGQRMKPKSLSDKDYYNVLNRMLSELERPVDITWHTQQIKIDMRNLLYTAVSKLKVEKQVDDLLQ